MRKFNIQKSEYRHSREGGNPGFRLSFKILFTAWIPAFAGMTVLILFSSPAHAKVLKNPLTMVVTASVADVRTESAPHNDKYEYDLLQETQVLKGEPVQVFEKKGKWMRVECPDQLEYTHNDHWQGYPGWIEGKYLSKNLKNISLLKKINKPLMELRQEILAQASRHLGNRYLWGGRSLYDPSQKNVLTGVDCSGLVNWSFRQVGMAVPRDAHEQFMKARPCSPKELKPGDLIFLAKIEKPEKIVHVMFYAGDENILEAPQSGENVRKISFRDRFGKHFSEIKERETVGDRILHFGTLLEDNL